MSSLGKVSVSGADHLDGPIGKVVVCNHVGWADPLWLGYAAYPRVLHQMAKKELFESPVTAWFVRSGGGFPVDRGRPTPATIRHSIALVERGELLLIFPAGTRSQEDADTKRGAATIALRAKAQIIPAYFEGPAQMRISHLWRRPAIRVAFGSPIMTEAIGASDKAKAKRLTGELDTAMKALRYAPAEGA
jgi:1-acyl-sn-glycerol-3-phosphate acyltransferase